MRGKRVYCTIISWINTQLKRNNLRLTRCEYASRTYWAKLCPLWSIHDFFGMRKIQFFYLYFYFSSNKKGDLRLMPRWISENRKQFQLRNLNVFQQTLQENSNGIIATESAREIIHFPQLAKLSALERTAGESVKPTTVTSSSTFPSQVTTPTL